MKYPKQEALKCFDECKQILSEYNLPDWDGLPSFGLYMDQVIEFVRNQLSVLSSFNPETPDITRPMINNYVKLKMMPAPVGKKYGRVHLAYILIICTLKQTLNISTIQKILPLELSEEEVKYTYNSFINNQQKAFKYVYGHIESVATPILSTQEDNPERIDDLLLQVASSAYILKHITEKVINFKQEN